MAHSHADHGHGHDHDHDHSHTPTITSDNERKVLLSFGLIFTFMAVEVVGGLLSGSLALLAEHGMDPWADVHVAARLILQGTVDRMPPHVRLTACSEWAARLHQAEEQLEGLRQFALSLPPV